MVAVQMACSINNGESYSEILIFGARFLKDFGLTMNDLLPKERMLILNKITQEGNEAELSREDIVSIVWTYEAYWSLIWALDMITDKEMADASKVCNTERAWLSQD